MDTDAVLPLRTTDGRTRARSRTDLAMHSIRDFPASLGETWLFARVYACIDRDRAPRVQGQSGVLYSSICRCHSDCRCDSESAGCYRRSARPTGNSVGKNGAVFACCGTLSLAWV